MFRLTDTGKQRNAEYHKGYVLLFLLVTCKSRCAGLCFYANGWVSSWQPMSQPQPLKPHGVAGHSSVPALGVRTQGSASSLCRGGTYLGALLGLAAILGCRGWGAHLIFQAARRWVGPSPLALHLGMAPLLLVPLWPAVPTHWPQTCIVSVSLKTVMEPEWYCPHQPPPSHPLSISFQFYPQS